MAQTAHTPQTGEKPSKKAGFWKRYFASPDPATLTPAQRWYNNVSSLPMFIVSITWLVSTFFTWSPALSPIYRREGLLLSLATWLIFALDLSIRFALDPRKKDFLKRDWPLMVALLFPPLRILLVITAVMRVARDRNALAKIVGLYAVYAVTFVVIFGSLFTLMFEINAPGASIKSFGDSVWWAFTTITTVGYGDFTPVTVPGRVIAVGIMFTGAAAVGAVTAALASRFINSAGSSKSQSSHAPQGAHGAGSVESDVDELLAHMKSMDERLRELVDRLDQAPATRGSEGG